VYTLEFGVVDVRSGDPGGGVSFFCLLIAARTNQPTTTTKRTAPPAPPATMIKLPLLLVESGALAADGFCPEVAVIGAEVGLAVVAVVASGDVGMTAGARLGDKVSVGSTLVGGWLVKGEGTAAGACGAAVGATVTSRKEGEGLGGCVVGTRVGPLVGSSVGWLVGSGDGRSVGLVVGVGEGGTVGSAVSQLQSPKMAKPTVRPNPAPPVKP
jgi:hypothetical protein